MLACDLFWTVAAESDWTLFIAVKGASCSWGICLMNSREVGRVVLMVVPVERAGNTRAGLTMS